MTRLRELLLRMEEVDPDRFATTLKSLKGLDLESLWAPLEVRRSETAMGWKKWLAGEGEVPAKTPEKPQIHISDMSEPVLPELDDALASLDDLGFLD
jgi:predicted secreted protein